MNRLLVATSPKAFHGLEPAKVNPLPEKEWHASKPARHLMIVDDHDRLHARCSVWFRVSRAPGSRATGAIGHYASASDEAAAALLENACVSLAAHGCDYVVGPMDGTTWRSYRFVTGGSSAPSFLFEPCHPTSYPNQFQHAGFHPCARYASALNPGPMRISEAVTKVRTRLERRGIVIRPFRVPRADEELKAIYRLSSTVFRNSLFYEPIGEEDFLALYRPLMSLIAPEVILMAEREGELQGFIFAVPDVSQARRGESVDTLVLKTLARLPGASRAGLGTVLHTEAEHVGARRLGLHRSIHALMRADNMSVRMSSRSAETMRQYALFGRRLAS